MKSVDARTGIEWLDRRECLALLSADEIGRLAIVVGAAPTIFPVNYRLDGEDIVFRTDPGAKLDHGPRAPACFEIDHFDRTTRSGWSVVVADRFEEVSQRHHHGAGEDQEHDLDVHRAWRDPHGLPHPRPPRLRDAGKHHHL